MRNLFVVAFAGLCLVTVGPLPLTGDAMKGEMKNIRRRRKPIPT